MKTINTIFKNNSFTDLEKLVLTQCNEDVKGNYGETWSPIDVQVLAKDTDLTVNQVKGVISSLVKKNILTVDEEFGMISFTEQEEMIYEPVIITELVEENPIKTSLLNKIKQLNSGGRLDLSIEEVKVLQDDDEKLIEEVIEMNLLFGSFSTDIIKIENNSGELFDFIEDRGSMVGFPVIYMENEIIILESAYGHGKEDKVYTSKAFAFIN